MYELSTSEIKQVIRDIKRQEINFSHLFDDLVDHVCCDVEEEMSNGLDFEVAYTKVKMKFSPERFREIQKETLFVVDKKYRFMKNVMKISGVAGTLIFGCSALFKVQHWPGAAIMMTIGAFILAIMFLPSALAVLWKETHSKGRIFLMVASFITGFFFIGGTLFKTMHWPFAGIFLGISFVSAIFLFVPSLLVLLFNDPEKKSFRMVYITASIGFIFYISGTLFKIQHWPFGLTLLVAGIFLLGFVVFPWYTVLKFREEKSVSLHFLFVIIALVTIIVPGALINLSIFQGESQSIENTQGVVQGNLTNRTDTLPAIKENELNKSNQ